MFFPKFECFFENGKRFVILLEVVVCPADVVIKRSKPFIRARLWAGFGEGKRFEILPHLLIGG